MTNLLIKNARAIATMDEVGRELFDADILIEGPAIKAVGQNLTASPEADLLHASNKVILPGFVNTHHSRRKISGDLVNE